MIIENDLICKDNILLICDECKTYFREGKRIRANTTKDAPYYTLCGICFDNKYIKYHDKIYNELKKNG